MADTTATENDYEATIEEAGPAKKRLNVTIPADVVAAKLNDAMGALIAQTSLPGFRKGRVPKTLIERRFGTQMRAETKSQLIADTYAKAIEDHELKPVGEPEPVGNLEDVQIEDGKPLTFAIEVEVVPEFELPDYENLEIKKPVVDVTDEHVENELQRQCHQAGETEDVQSDFKEGDRLIGPGTATKEGEDEPFFRHDKIDFLVPSTEDGGRGHVLGLLVDDLAAKLKDVKIGDKLTIETVGPEAHELEHIRGAKLTIEITIREGHRLHPAPVEKLVEFFGMPNDELLREQLRLALEQRRDEEQRNAMREQVYEHFVGAVEFDLPRKLSEDQTARMIERQRMDLLYRGGLSADEVETKLAEMRSETESQSQNRLKLFFLLRKLADHFNVDVSEQEINGRIAAIASQRGMRPDQVREDLVKRGFVAEIANQIRDQKAADRVIDHARVTEVSIEEWEERVSKKRSEAASKAGTKKKTTKKKTAAKASTTKKTTTKKKTTKKKTTPKD